MGLFDEFDVDVNEVEETGGFREIPDGVYPFEISEARRQHGSNNNPDTEFFVITYNLEEEGEKQDWIVVGNLDEDGNLSPDMKGLGRVKAVLLKLGFDASELANVEPEDLEGIRGVLKLSSSTSKKTKKVYQNVAIQSVEGDDEPTPEPEPKPKASAETKRRVAAKSTPAAEDAPKRTRRSTPAPAEDDDENPFG